MKKKADDSEDKQFRFNILLTLGLGVMEEEMGVVMTGEITMVAMAHLGTTTKVAGDGMGLPTRMTTLTTPDHPNRPMRIVSSQNALNY